MTIPRDLSNLAPGANTSGVLQTNKGGTGLTTLTAANNALYSTSSSALTAGTLPVAAGGTGATTLTGYVKGSGTSALSSSLTIPTTDLSGSIAVANGGTGASSLTLNNVILGNGASAVQFVAPGTNGNVLTSNGTTWVSSAPAASLIGETNSGSPYKTSLGYRAGPNNTGTWNTFVGNECGYQNTIGVDNTAIGAGALTSNVNGNYNTAIGRLALSSNTGGNNNIAIGNSAGFSLTSGSNTIVIGANAAASSATASNEVTLGDTNIVSTRLRGMVELNAAMFEQATVSATAATGTINFDTRTQSVLYYTSNASGNWTLNIRASSGVSLNTAMTTGQSLTIAFLVTNGATAYYQTALQVDGASVTPKWQGGTAPTAGNASSIDAYVITIIKTASATFTALASQTRFA